MRYRITISRDGIDKGDARPILVEDTRSGRIMQAARVRSEGPFDVVFDAAGLANGARVWIETDAEPVEVRGPRVCLGCQRPIASSHAEGCPYRGAGRRLTVQGIQTRIAPV